MSQVPSPTIRPFIVSDAEVIRRAEALGRDLFPKPSALPFMWKFDFDTVYDQVIYPNYGIQIDEDHDLGFDSTGNKILGEFDPINNIAYIDVSLKNDPRRVFTRWHEVCGHGVLQGEWLRAEIQRIGVEESVITTDLSLNREVESQLELQANKFASYAAAPTAILDRAIKEQFALTRNFRYIGPKTYNFASPNGLTEYKRCNSFLELCRHIAKRIQYQFGYLSIEALSYRVCQSKWVIDETVRPQIFTLRRVAGAASRRKSAPVLPTAHHYSGFTRRLLAAQ